MHRPFNLITELGLKQGGFISVETDVRIRSQYLINEMNPLIFKRIHSLMPAMVVVPIGRVV